MKTKEKFDIETIVSNDVLDINLMSQVLGGVSPGNLTCLELCIRNCNGFKCSLCSTLCIDNCSGVIYV